MLLLAFLLSICVHQCVDAVQQSASKTLAVAIPSTSAIPTNIFPGLGSWPADWFFAEYYTVSTPEGSFNIELEFRRSRMQEWSSNEKTAAQQAILRARDYVRQSAAHTITFQFDSRVGQHLSDARAYFTLHTVHANSRLRPALEMALRKLLELILINGGIDAWIYLSGFNAPHQKDKWATMEIRRRYQEYLVARRGRSWGGLQRDKRAIDQQPSVISSLQPVASGSAALGAWPAGWFFDMRFSARTSGKTFFCELEFQRTKSQVWTKRENDAAIMIIARAIDYVLAQPDHKEIPFRFDSRAGQRPLDSEVTFYFSTEMPSVYLKEVLIEGLKFLNTLVLRNNGGDFWINVAVKHGPDWTEKWVRMRLVLLRRFIEEFRQVAPVPSGTVE